MDKSAPWGPDATELQDLFGDLGIAQDIAKGKNNTCWWSADSVPGWKDGKPPWTRVPTLCVIYMLHAIYNVSIEYLIKEVTFNWGQTQFDTTIDQLNHGIRYLDYRDPLF